MIALLAASATAGSFDVVPAKVVLDPSAHEVAVRNTGADAVVLQARGIAVQASGGLAISPPFLTVLPGETRFFRVRPTDLAGPVEQAWDLVVEEIHLGLSATSIPVFRPGMRPATRDVDVDVVLREGELTVALANRGDAHVAAYEIAVGGPGSPFQALRQGAVVRAGADRREVFFVPADACHALDAIEVVATIDDAVVRTSLPVDASDCARGALANAWTAPAGRW